MLFVGWQGVLRAWPWRKVAVSGAALASVTVLLVAPYPILAGKITSKQLPFFKQHSAPTFIAQLAEVPVEKPANDAPAESISAEPAVEVAQAPAELASEAAAVAKPPAEVAVEERKTAPDALAERAPSPAEGPAGEPARRYSIALVARLAGGGVAALVECFCHAFRFVFIPFYLIGQWEMIRRETPKRLIAFLWILASLHMVILLWVYFVSGYISSRHVLPLLGLAMPFTALGILYVEEKLMVPWPVKAPRIAFATVALCSLVVLPYAVRSYNREFVPVIEATRWIERQAPAGAGVVCNSPYVGYYGALPTTVLGPKAVSLDAALRQGDPHAHFDYVVLHVNAHGYRPEWLAQIEQRYRVVREYDDPTEARRRAR